jgi:hypothetical protein
MAFRMSPGLRAAFERECALARDARAGGELDRAFGHYERAHILSQRYTWRHVASHVGMLRIGWQRGDRREVFGQLKRIVAASLFSRIWIPVGNTGGANVDAMRPMPVPEDLQRILSAG